MHSSSSSSSTPSMAAPSSTAQSQFSAIASKVHSFCESKSSRSLVENPNFIKLLFSIIMVDYEEPLLSALHSLNKLTEEKKDGGADEKTKEETKNIRTILANYPGMMTRLYRLLLKNQSLNNNNIATLAQIAVDRLEGYYQTSENTNTTNNNNKTAIPTPTKSAAPTSTTSTTPSTITTPSPVPFMNKPIGPPSSLPFKTSGLSIGSLKSFTHSVSIRVIGMDATSEKHRDIIPRSLMTIKGVISVQIINNNTINNTSTNNEGGVVLNISTAVREELILQPIMDNIQKIVIGGVTPFKAERTVPLSSPLSTNNKLLNGGGGITLFAQKKINPVINNNTNTNNNTPSNTAAPAAAGGAAPRLFGGMTSFFWGK